MRRARGHRRRSEGSLNDGPAFAYQSEGTFVSVSDTRAPRILVVRLGSMGDIIHTLPAVTTLRACLPDAVIGWAVELRWTSLLSTNAAIDGPRSPAKPLVDFVHIVDTLAWRSALLSDETWREIRDSLAELRSLSYDVAID